MKNISWKDKNIKLGNRCQLNDFEECISDFKLAELKDRYQKPGGVVAG